uniref:Uncharacterized protein LOC114336210 n=1 Tax=Diabrotica virgifera virgifera TaxID=50390 RepID=A0A6P7GDX4_DIAVI
MLKVVIILVVILVSINAQIPSVENADGSWSIGITSEGQGSTADSVLGLLSMSSGWTPSSLQNPDPNSGPLVPSAGVVSNVIGRSVEKLLKNLRVLLVKYQDTIALCVRMLATVLSYLFYTFRTGNSSINDWIEVYKNNCISNK